MSLSYIGYKDPIDNEEANIEILGLATIIAAAQQRIAVLNQSLALTLALKNSTVEESNAQTISTPEPATET
jgi:hypothetical protein